MRLALLAVIAACGSNPPAIKIGPPPAKITKGTLAGATCQDTQCKCRSGAEDGGVGVPTDGRKRYEVKLESAYDLWVTVHETVLYKSPETASACFYVDLAPGKHPVSIRASNKAGVSLAVEIHELGTGTKSWYDTFQFKCGHPGVCTFDELDTKKSEYTGKKGLHDKCGSTKIRKVVWDHGKVPDGQHPNELAVELLLDIYKFAPWLATGDANCGKQRKAPSGEPTFDETGSGDPATP